MSKTNINVGDSANLNGNGHRGPFANGSLKPGQKSESHSVSQAPPLPASPPSPERSTPRWHTNVSLGHKIVVGLGLVLLGMTALALISHRATEQVRVGSPLYKHLILNKDLVSDIVPPSVCIIEPYLVSKEISTEQSSFRLKMLLKYAVELQKEYDDRHAYWTENLPAGPARELIMLDAHQAAQTFFTAEINDFIPAIQRKDHAKATEILETVLKPAYYQQRMAIDQATEIVRAGAKAAEQNADAVVRKQSRWTLVATAVIWVCSALVCLGLVRSISRPLRRMKDELSRIDQGDTSLRLTADRGDEIGQVANTFNATLDKLAEQSMSVEQLARDKASTAEAKSRADAVDIAARKVAEANLNATIAAVNRNSQSIASAAEELTATSQQMSSNCEAASAQSNAVASASEQVSKNVASVATSAEEMSLSVKEIARNASEAAKVATNASRVAGDTNKTVAKLGESSIEIGKVIKVITSIAQQTNLLALNATIEAARAGEAGKGFAVVANEVKELAKQTAAATEDIIGKIEAIQTDTKGAVNSIGQIGNVISQIKDFTTLIASAVEEQSATMNTIAQNAIEAARSSTEISKNIVNVSQAAHNISEGSGNILSAATDLAKLAANLKQIVEPAKV